MLHLPGLEHGFGAVRHDVPASVDTRTFDSPAHQLPAEMYTVGVPEPTRPAIGSPPVGGVEILEKWRARLAAAKIPTAQRVPFRLHLFCVTRIRRGAIAAIAL
jgi:hypothetical protein